MWLFVLLLLQSVCAQDWYAEAYWNQRYQTEPAFIKLEKWLGWWNDAQNQRQYERPKIPTIAGGTKCQQTADTLNCRKPNTKKYYYFVKPSQPYLDRFVRIDENTFYPNTKSIEIAFTKLMYIAPNTFHNLKELQTLVIAQSELYEIPDLSQCTKLEKLDLYGNNIQMFRHNYTSLPKSLKQINFIENEIYKFPMGYFNLPNLQYLGLARNKIRYFPSEAFTEIPSNLQYMGVNENELTNLYEKELLEVAKWPSLQHLNVSNNLIEYIAPKAFSKLRNLYILELQNNKISTMQKYSLWKMEKLVHLDLHGNLIETLNSQFVVACEKLKILILYAQKRKMKNIYYDALSQLPKLVELWLGSNELTRFPHPLLFEETFPSLQKLYVDNNQITSLNEYSGKDFPESAQIYYL